MALDITAINQTLDQATSTLQGLLKTFGQSPPTSDGQFSSIQNSASTVSMNFLGNANDQLTNNIINGVLNPLQNEFNSIKSGLEGIGTDISSTLNSAFQGIGTIFSDIKSGIQTSIGNLESSVSGGFNFIVNDLTSGFQGLTSFIGNGLNILGQSLVTGISDVVTSVAGEVDKIAATVGSGISTIAATMAQEGNIILGAVESIPKAVGGLADTILAGLGKIIVTAAEDTWKSGVAQTLIADLEQGAREISSWMRDYITNALTEFMPFISEPPDATVASDFERFAMVAAMQQLIGSLEEASPQVAFILGPLINKLGETINIGFARDLEQVGNWQKPNTLLDIGNLIEGTYRGTVNQDSYYIELQKEGISKSNADIIYSNTVPLMQINDLIASYYRGIIPDINTIYGEAARIRYGKGYVDRIIQLYEQLIGPTTSIELWRRKILPDGWSDYFDDARRAGWTPERIKALQDISYVIPNPQTLKQFILHKADDDAFAIKYGLDEGINQDYYDRAAAMGYTEADAKRLYRTEWSYPQLFILRTMYTAGEVSQADFETILGITGMPPYFVKALADNLKPKLTQGDIKDMYKYQVIKATDIVPELEKVGIAGDLAASLEKLWVASVKLAAPIDQTAAQTKIETIKGLNMSIIKENYIDQAITKDQAITYLKELGYAQEEIDLNINVWDIAQHKTTVSQTITALKEQAAARAISLNDAIIALQQLNLNANQVVTYTIEIEKAMKVRTKTPTLAEVEKWFKDSLITPTEFVNALEMLGYSSIWIPYYLVVAGMTAQEVTDMGFTFSAFQ